MRPRHVLPALTLSAVFLLAAAPASASEAMARNAGCLGCHTVDKKLVGPAYKDVAAKYKGRKDAVAFLSGRVRAGGPGNWGEVPMAPSGPDKISDDDLKTVIAWILKQ